MRVGTLYVVATPLGHLGDLSPRAADTLRQVAVVAAEDTRRTRPLLQVIGASPRLMAWHAHSGPQRTAAVLTCLTSGQDVALVTDAGTPAISDPGVILVAAAQEAGVPVVPIPGPSAVATALSCAGLPVDRYLFLGFIPRKGKERAKLLQQAADLPWASVFFEAPGRLVPLLEDLLPLTGPDREAVVARELTKVHEEFRRDTLTALAAHYTAVPPRGEVTVVLAGAPESVAAPVVHTVDDFAATISAGRAAGDTRRDLVQRLITEHGVTRNEAYRLVAAE